MPFAPQVNSVTSQAPPAVAWKKAYDYDGSNNMIYEGWAVPGTATSAALWAIKKYTYTGSNLTLETWADGDTLPNNIWDNRAALTYA